MNHAEGIELTIFDDQESASSVELAYDEILRRIVYGELQEGAPIKGALLAKEMGLSRTPVVQAIARLSSEGILNQELNHRAVVAAGAERWFFDLHEVRILLEPEAAGIAAGKLSKETLSELYRLSEQIDQAKETKQRRQAAFRFDVALHTTIAKASGNLMIRSIISNCMSFKRFSYLRSDDLPLRLERANREHMEILQAIENGDAKTASAAMLFHLRSTFGDFSNSRVI